MAISVPMIEVATVGPIVQVNSIVRKPGTTELGARGTEDAPVNKAPETIWPA